MYSWDADVRDAMAVMDSIGVEPMPVVGHSKGGMLMVSLSEACPHRVSHVVNIDGFPTRLEWWGEADVEIPASRVEHLEEWLEARRGGRRQRRPATSSDLAARRAGRNPRLPPEWIEHLVSTGAKPSGDGWAWKMDATLDPSITQVMRQEWGLQGFPGLGMPVLVILGLVAEQMPMDQTPESLAPYLPSGAEVIAYEDSGHFVHVEHPQRTAEAIHSFLTRHPVTRRQPPGPEAGQAG